MSSLFETLKPLPICETIQSLGFAHNKFDKLSTSYLSSFLPLTKNLRFLDLSKTDIDFKDFGFENNDSHPTIEILILSENKNLLAFSNDKKYLLVFKFLSRMPNLKKVEFAQTNLSRDLFELLFSVIPSIEELNISNNSLNDEGIISLCSCLLVLKNLKLLDISNNFEKLTKYRSNAISQLATLISENRIPLKSLNISANSRNALKKDIMPLIYAFISNTSISLLVNFT